MKFAGLLVILLSVFAAAGDQVLAQGRNEIALSVGAGSLQVNPGGGTTPVFSVSYQFHITDHFSAEGALDTFYYSLPTSPLISPSGVDRDDYLGTEVAVAYYFRARREAGRWLPRTSLKSRRIPITGWEQGLRTI